MDGLNSDRQTKAVFQEVEWVIHLPEGWWFNPCICQSACQNVHGKDNEPGLLPFFQLV